VDVHPPHEPIHTWKDFLLHLLTITIGLFIALMLEASVSAIHHRHLVKEAKANLATEIGDNSKTIDEQLQQIRSSESRLRTLVAVVEEIRHGGKIPSGGVGFSWSSTTLDDTSWNTAQITGAMAYMGYSDAKHYSQIYQMQKIFLTEQQAAETAFLDIGSSRSVKEMSPVELRQLEHAYSSALAHASDMEGIANALRQLYAAFEHAPHTS
jgi:hypothetical protein